MNLDDALNTFFVECEELRQQMEHSLLRLEQAPDDPETVNAIFRAAHTIKGSAGLFGLDRIVAFTHVAETVLDALRNGELRFNEELGALFLQVCDHIGELVAEVAENRDGGETVRARSAALTGRLRGQLGPEEDIPATQAPDVPPPAAPPCGGEAEAEHWHISLRFGPDMLRNGLDPLSFLRYLGTLGRIVGIATLTDAVPGMAGMDPETCYLGFEIALQSTADKATIESAFDFARDDSRIRILPPKSRISEYLELIRAIPEEDLRLGEILVRCGTLTAVELAAALKSQEQQAAQPPRPIGQLLVEESLVHPPVLAAALKKQKQTKESKQGENSLIRVDAAKLDRFINLIGELVIAGAGANLAAHRAGAAELIEATSTISRLVEEVRDSALNLRMVQIAPTFNRFQRVVRDVGKELGKEINLEISGGDTELDKTVVEKIGDPLTHLVRNAIDHGIGLPQVRLARGKPAAGTVRLNAYHDSGSIVIEVSDDGSGLKKEKILQRAIERGLIPENHRLSDKEIYNLIFEPGFSTAAQVSNISGRGVGMDVVKRSIQALRGTVDLDSVPGQGTTVHIRLPLTLAIIDGFLVGVGQGAYVLPLDMVVECIELNRGGEGAASRRDYLNLRGEVLPFVRLREMFEEDGAPPRRENVVVVQYAGHRAGLVVDQLMGEYQTVIKPLGKVFDQVRGIGGFTILGSGDVALILDVPNLVRQAADRGRHTRHLAFSGDGEVNRA